LAPDNQTIDRDIRNAGDAATSVVSPHTALGQTLPETNVGTGVKPNEGREAKYEKIRGGWKLSAGGLVLALLTAVLTGAVSYAYGVANDVRKVKLDFVNAQIEKLYGPLYSATMASNALWSDFPFYPSWRHPDSLPTVDQVRRWRHWMRTVFQPLNLKADEAIIANSHLVIGGTMPTAFQGLVAHVEGYKAVIATWSANYFRDCQQHASAPTPSAPCPAITLPNNSSLIPYPSDIVQCVTKDFTSLKQRQQELQNGLVAAFFAGSVIRSPSCDSPRR
jgi:hypothetical protein